MDKKRLVPIRADSWTEKDPFRSSRSEDVKNRSVPIWGWKRRCSASVFLRFLRFCDIFWREGAVKGRWNGRKLAKNRCNFKKNAFFYPCKQVIINVIKNKSKIIEKSLKKCWMEIKKSYLCTRKTTGTAVKKRERLFSEVLWTNDPSKVWKVRVQEYEKNNLINF